MMGRIADMVLGWIMAAIRREIEWHRFPTARPVRAERGVDESSQALDSGAQLSIGRASASPTVSLPIS